MLMTSLVDKFQLAIIDVNSGGSASLHCQWCRIRTAQLVRLRFVSEIVNILLTVVLVPGRNDSTQPYCISRGNPLSGILIWVSFLCGQQKNVVTKAD